MKESPSAKLASLRTIVREDGSVEFIAKDVCSVLDYSDTSMALRRLDDDEKGTTIVCTPGGEQRLLTVTEPGLYRLLATSRVEKAKAFTRWVTHEVLPALRQTGKFEVDKAPVHLAT